MGLSFLVSVRSVGSESWARFLSLEHFSVRGVFRFWVFSLVSPRGSRPICGVKEKAHKKSEQADATITATSTN